jgi:hypothetical protein
VPAEPTQGCGRHDHPSTERTGDTRILGWLTPEREQTYSFVDLALCRCCGASREGGFDTAAASRQEITEAMKTLLGRMELPKYSDAVRFDLHHGASRFLSSAGEEGVRTLSDTGGTALVSPPFPCLDAPAPALFGFGP